MIMPPPVSPMIKPTNSFNFADDLSRNEKTNKDVRIGFNVVTRTPPTPASPIWVEVRLV